MKRIGTGLLAGLIATIVLSALMVAKAVMGIMPALDLPRMLAGMAGSPNDPSIGWVIHFVIGVVLYGVAMALLGARVRTTGSAGGRGVLLGIAGWLIMMVALMPMAGAGMFGMRLGAMAPVMTLMLHLIFGAVLGWSFGGMLDGQPRDREVRMTHA